MSAAPIQTVHIHGLPVDIHFNKFDDASNTLYISLNSDYCDIEYMDTMKSHNSTKLPKPEITISNADIQAIQHDVLSKLESYNTVMNSNFVEQEKRIQSMETRIKQLESKSKSKSSDEPKHQDASKSKVGQIIKFGYSESKKEIIAIYPVDHKNICIIYKLIEGQKCGDVESHVLGYLNTVFLYEK